MRQERRVAGVGAGAAARPGSTTLQGTEVVLSAEAAELLNSTFGTDALAGGFPIGTATITVPTS